MDDVVPAVKGMDLVAVLREARALLALPSNDFAWSSWEDAGSALAELDEHIAVIEAGGLPPQAELTVLFAPTGPVQEVSSAAGGPTSSLPSPRGSTKP